MNLIAASVLCLSTLASAQVLQKDIDFVSKTFYPATTLLYSQDQAGDMKMRCTATSIEKTKTGYVFVTAAHCACEDDVESKTVTPEKTSFYLTSDSVDHKEFLHTSLVGCGYRHAGDDFAFFQVDTELVFPVIELGVDPSPLEPIVNVASPLGLGKQTFLGSVSSASLDRPVVVDDINWSHAVLFQLFGTDGGSSGSAVVCLDQKKICALIVGSINRTTITGVPVSRLIATKKALEAGTYDHWNSDPDGSKKDKKK